MKKVISAVLIICLVFCLVSCGETKEKVPEGNIVFASLEEMQECLNGKWFSIQSGLYSLYPIYTEIIFNDNEIKDCKVTAWSTENDTNENGEIIGTKYVLSHYENLKFNEYSLFKETPKFNHKTGQVLFDTEHSNISIKKYANVSNGKVINGKYLLIGNEVYFKATDKTDLSCENFEIFLKFCNVAINNDATRPFISMRYKEENKDQGVKKGIDKKGFFAYEGCDSNEISFEIYMHHDYSPSHYFARTDEFSQLYHELRDSGNITNIIGLIGTDMPYFDKKDWQEHHRFKELKYYLYMNSEGKLVSNIG